MKLINWDCLEEMDKLIEQWVVVDSIITDIPYNTTACAWDKLIPFDEMWLRLNKLIKPNWAIVLFGSQPFTTKLINSNIEKYSHQWIWEKEQGANPLLANIMPMKNFEDIIVFINEYKNYDYENKNPLRDYFKEVMEFIGLNLKQINTKLWHRRAEHTFYIDSTQYGLCTEKTYLELIDVFGIDQVNEFKEFAELKEIDNQFKKRFASTFNLWEGNKYKSNILKYKKDCNGFHPTQKPILLLEDLIKTFSNENDLVVDLTMGSGSTGVACVNTNRNFIGIEMNDTYFDIAQERIQKAKNELKLF